MVGNQNRVRLSLPVNSRQCDELCWSSLAALIWPAALSRTILIVALTLGLQQTGGMFVSRAILFTAVLMFCMLPWSFAYAMLRHGLFDLRIIVRIGLQYALARGMILALVPVAIAARVVDVRLHGDQPLRAVLVDRGWTYGTIAAVTLFAYSQRERWMASLDRRFFRERYAAQQILRAVVEDVGRTPDLDTAARNSVGSSNRPEAVQASCRPWRVHSCSA